MMPGDIVVHFFIEFFTGALCLLIASFAWRDYRQQGQSFFLWWAVAFAGAGVFYIAHGMAPLAGLDNSGAVRFTALIARSWLLILMGVAALKSGQPSRSMYVFLALFGVGVLVSAWLEVDAERINAVDPATWLSALSWLLLGGLYYRSLAARAIGPTGMVTFIGLGTLVQLTFGAAQAVGDSWWYAAHLLRMIEFVVWGYAAWQHMTDTVMARDFDAIIEARARRLGMSHSQVQKLLSEGAV